MRLVLFLLALFLPAALLGWVELLVGRLLLPQLGGTPAVWNTCLVFFQAAVLAGYLLAHVLGRLRPRVQVAVHALLLAAAGLSLVHLDTTAPAIPPDGSALALAGALLLWLARTVGPVAVVLCASAPLFQQWFSRLGHARSGDPYFLYAASNLGTLLGLLGHPLVIEPFVSAPAQARGWAIGFLAFALVAIAAGLSSVRESAAIQGESESAPESDPRRTMRWFLLSFLPCSLLHGVTTTLTTDVAAVPLLWALPLLVYLGTFGAAFLPNAPLVPTWLEKLELACMALLGGVSLLNPPLPTAPLLALHLATYAALAWSLHRRLAAERPETARLTQFYVVVSLGGVAGGLFNALAAPLVFDAALEYPAMLALSGLVLVSGGAGTREPEASRARGILPFLIGIVGAVLLAGVHLASFPHRAVGLVLLAGLLALSIRALRPCTIHAVVATGIVLLVGVFSLVSMGVPVRAERSFFAVHRVVRDERAGWVSYLHGTTLHGRQWLAREKIEQPLTYFDRTGPVGALFAALDAEARTHRVAVLGLGIGTLAAYEKPGDSWTFFEIDPVVERIARDPAYFSFLSGAKGSTTVEVGDGRLLLAGKTERSFDLLVMDAFSSDAVPVHLLTREAFQLYANRLAPEGTLALNVTNRFLDLEDAIAAAAREQGFSGMIGIERDVPPGIAGHGKTSSRWIVLRRGPLPAALLADARFRPLRTTDAEAWTDAHANVLSAIRLAGPR